MIQFNPRQWQILSAGSPTQQEAYQILQQTNIFSILKPFDPAHVGTIGNDLDIPGSDIDIICSADDFQLLSEVLRDAFGALDGFSLEIMSIRGKDALVCSIPSRIPIEIYAENSPVNSQLGYRHYLIACRVLDILGDEAHEEIRKLKQSGIKTEPAFVQYLGIAGGDPYLSFLKVEEMSDGAIRLLRDSFEFQRNSFRNPA